MYKYTYRPLFAAVDKLQFPFEIFVDIEFGSIEMYVSSSPDPSIDNNDFFFQFFDKPIKIEYDFRINLKTIYINIYCLELAKFSLRIKWRVDIFKIFNKKGKRDIEKIGIDDARK